jgi:hypothetical protein
MEVPELMIRHFENSDILPPLPDAIDKKRYIAWGELLVARSTRFADRNRFAAIYLGPIVAFLTSVTAAAGAGAAIDARFDSSS